MNFLVRLAGRGRVRAARRDLARDPSPLSYVRLVRACAAVGLVREARSVCEEGLEAFSGSAELKRMVRRARRAEHEQRLAQLRVELDAAPRPALWRETGDILLETGQLEEAARHAGEWSAAVGDSEAHLFEARVGVECFFTDRSRSAGAAALARMDALERELPAEPRLWALRLRMASAIGAWGDARRCAAQLLRLQPGNQDMEARFRWLDGMADGARDPEQALLQVERTGELNREPSDDQEQRAPTTNVHDLLGRLVSGPAVEAAFYLRGATALVKGARGATAERSARAVQSVLQTSRTTARRLGLGQVYRIKLEGDFGTLAIAPGEVDAGAVWSRGVLPAGAEQGLLNIAGIDAPTAEQAR